MAHLYTRNAFKVGFNNVTPSSPPLLSAYCRLVSIELLLKEYLAAEAIPCTPSHDIPLMLDRLSTTLRGADVGAINSLRIALKSSLSGLWCQGLKNTAQKVPDKSYPYIRYLRHDTECATDCSTESAVVKLERLAHQLQALLFQITGKTV